MADPTHSDSSSESETILRVSSSSAAGPLASALSHAVYDGQHVALRAVGAGAVNQAVKAIAIAQSYVAMRGLLLYTRVGFTTVKMPDREVSGIVLRVEAK